LSNFLLNFIFSSSLSQKPPEPNCQKNHLNLTPTSPQPPKNAKRKKPQHLSIMVFFPKKKANLASWLAGEENVEVTDRHCYMGKEKEAKMRGLGLGVGWLVGWLEMD